MDDKNKKSGQTSKPEQDKKSNVVAQPATLTPTNQLPTNVKEAVATATGKELTTEQLAERKNLIERLTAELAAKMGQESANSPDVQKLADEAIAEVQRKRAEELAKAPTGTGITSQGKVDREPDRQRKSQISNPVKFVWELAEAMVKLEPTSRRKDIVNAAVKAGVALYTARTQYQAWYTMRRESQRQAALAQAKQAQAAQQTRQG